MATAEDRLGMSAAGTIGGRGTDEVALLGATLLKGCPALGTVRLGDGTAVGRSLRIDVSDGRRLVGTVVGVGIAETGRKEGIGATEGATTGAEIMGGGTTGGVGTNPLSADVMVLMIGPAGLRIGAIGSVGSPGRAGPAATGLALDSAAKEHAMNDSKVL